jgi:hypothetical protein
MVLQLDCPKYLANITIPCLGFPKDLILDLAIKLEHLGTTTGLISTGIKRILLEKITQGKITARWIDNSLLSKYKQAFRTKKRSHHPSNGK